MNRAKMGLTLAAFLCMISAVHASVLMCWDVSPFDDTFRVLADSNPDDEALFALTAVHWQGLNVYQMSGASATRLFESTPTTAEFSVFMDNKSSFFGGNPNCRLRVTLQREGMNGSWTIDCTGGGVKDFTISGTAVFNPSCGGVQAQSVQRAFAPQLAGQ